MTVTAQPEIRTESAAPSSSGGSGAAHMEGSGVPPLFLKRAHATFGGTEEEPANREWIRRTFEKPPVIAASAALQREVSTGEVRRVLFDAAEGDMAVLAALLRASADTRHLPVAMAACHCLWMVYSTDAALMRAFIEAGGMVGCTSMLAAAHEYVQAQVLVVLLACLSTTVFPWLDPPTTRGGALHAADQKLWCAMRDFAQSPIVPQLQRLWDDPFPGARDRSLHLFLVVIQWLRRFCSNGRVLLSAAMLSKLQELGAEERRAGVPAEQALAQRLYDEFSPLGSTEEAHHARAAAAAKNHDSDDDGFETRVVHDRTLVNDSKEGAELAMALKAEGNVAFARGDFTAAVALYSRALDTPIATPDLPREGGRRVAYLLNRAQAYLKRAPTTPDPAAPPDEYGMLAGVDLAAADAPRLHHEAALRDCCAALELDARKPKALFRKAAALRALGRLGEALDSARAAAAAAGDSVRLGAEAARLVSEVALEMSAAASAELD